MTQNKHAYMVNRILQVQEAVFNRVADIILRVGGGGGHLLISTAFSKLLMLTKTNTKQQKDSQANPKLSVAFLILFISI